MKTIKKFPCPKCRAKNDVDITWIGESGWKQAFGLETCWYCRKIFLWTIENDSYGK